MLYLVASFIDVESNNIIGFRVINYNKENNKADKYIDITMEDLVEALNSNSVQVQRVKNEEDLKRWAKNVTVFDVKTSKILTEPRYVKLSDTMYSDCAGNIYNVRNAAELDNFIYNHVFTNLDADENIEDNGVSESVKKNKVKRVKTEDYELYKKVCGIGNYDEILEQTLSYQDRIEYGEEIESELLDFDKAGRFNYPLSDKKDGKIIPCKDNMTGLYGVICLYEDKYWVLVEPKYVQLETVQSNTTTYVSGLRTDEYWVFIDIKKNLYSDYYLDWISINNQPGKSGKLFVVTYGDSKKGYIWHLMGKNLQKDRQIGCPMVLTDVLFSRGRGYTKLVNTLEFFDPRHGETVQINLKDYSMDSMINFRREMNNKSLESSKNVIETALYYNIICDVTTGEITLETDKEYKDSTIYFTDISSEFITSISLFVNATPKDEVLDVKVKRHMEQRHQYIYKKIDVETTFKLKSMLSHYATYSSAKVLGSYWTNNSIVTLDEAIKDLELSNYIKVTKCNDEKDLYYKGYLLVNTDNSVGLYSFFRREGRVIRCDYNVLIDNYESESLSFDGLTSLDVDKLEKDRLYKVYLSGTEDMNIVEDEVGAPTYDIVQKYRKNKLSIKSTSYKRARLVKLNASLDNQNTDDDLNFKLFYKVSDGLSFKTSEVELSKLDANSRNIEEVREHAKAYSKLMNENQPVLSGFHQTAFKCELV